MKVKELKELLNKYDDEMEVLIKNTVQDHEYRTKDLYLIDTLKEIQYAPSYLGFKSNKYLEDKENIQDGFYYFRFGDSVEKIKVEKGLLIDYLGWDIIDAFNK